MKFHEWFSQRLMADYGLEGRVYGEHTYMKDDEEIDEEVDDPYYTLDTTMQIEIRGKVRELYDRDKMKKTVSKPHIDYDNDTKYRFIIHQIKYGAVKDTLGFVINQNNSKKFFTIKKSNSDVFEGIDNCTKEYVMVTREGFEHQLPKKVMKTHAEQFARGFNPERGIICIPIGIYHGSIFYTKVDLYGDIGARVEIVRFHSDKGQIGKENTVIVLADSFRSIATSLITNVEVPWGNFVKHPMDLFRNPTNKDIWHLLPPAKTYEGKSVFINYDTYQTFVKVVDQWMPTNLTWLLSHKSEFLKEVESELMVIININNMEGAQA